MLTKTYIPYIVINGVVFSDGKMVIIGGYDKIGIDGFNLIKMDNILVFDTIQSAWMKTPEVKGSIPFPRVHHSAAVISKHRYKWLKEKNKQN